MHKLLQFTLDLFESAPAASKISKGNEKPDFQASKQPVADVISAHKAPEIIAMKVMDSAALPTQTLEQALAPATFSNPRASRQALMGSIVVAYEFKRGQRRTIGFSVGAEGLRVSAPKWVPLYEIDKAVLEKSAWIIQKLEETRARHDRLESARIEWKDGAMLPFLGEQVIVALDPRHAFGLAHQPGLNRVLDLVRCGGVWQANVQRQMRNTW